MVYKHEIYDKFFVLVILLATLTTYLHFNVLLDPRVVVVRNPALWEITRFFTIIFYEWPFAYIFWSWVFMQYINLHRRHDLFHSKNEYHIGFFFFKMKRRIKIYAFKLKIVILVRYIKVKKLLMDIDPKVLKKTQ